MPKETHITTAFRTGACKHPQSEAFATKYLHSPTDTPSNYCGYPDNNNSPSLQSEFRQTRTVTVPSVEQELYRDYLFLVSPGLTRFIYQATDLGGGDNRWTCEEISNGYGQSNQGIAKTEYRTLSSVRGVYGSSTFYNNTNTLADKGTITTSGFRPNYTYFNDLSTVSFRSRFGRHDGFEAVWKSLLAEALRRRQLVAGINDVDPLGDHVDPEPYVFVSVNVQVVKLGDPVTTEDQIMQASPKSTQTLAKEGAFVRQFFSQPTNPYMDVPTATVFTDDVNYLPYCAYEWTGANGKQNISFFTKSNADPTDVKHAIQDFPWSPIRWTYVYFRGVDRTAQPTIKTIRGYELQPVQKTLLSSQIRPSCLPDNMALETISEITSIAPDSLPSAFNDGGPDATAQATFEAGGAESKHILENIKHEDALNSIKGRQATPTHPREQPKKSRIPIRAKEEAKDGHANRRPPVQPSHAKSVRRPPVKGVRSDGHGKPRDKVSDVTKQANKASNAVKKIRRDVKSMKI